MKIHLSLFCAAAVVLLTASLASAATYTFDFNTLKDPSNYGDPNNAVQVYMNGILSGGASVKVTGAMPDEGNPSKSSGNNSYIGEGYVVGPGNGSASLTLGNSDGATSDGAPNLIKKTGDITSYDTFIRNNGFSSASGSDRITMQFTGVQIYSVSFDYEVFPDGTCPSLSNCGGRTNPNLPDFIFQADGAQIWQKFGVVPGTSGTYSKSPQSSSETAPQLLGTGTWMFTTPVSKLDFIDWPAMIGIDNLRITTTVPEPGSVVFLASICLACGFFVRKKLTA